MKNTWILLLLLFPWVASSSDVDLPMVPEERAVIGKMVEIEGVELILSEKPNFSIRRAYEDLSELGFPSKRLAVVSLHDRNNPKRAIAFTYLLEEHRVVAMTGNGPWLSNESLRLLAGLPELRLIRLDHNTPLRGSDVPIDQYDGSAFEALKESKLKIVKIGHAFGDRGMEALAGISSLKRIEIGHSRVTDAGAASLAEHPNLVSVSFAPMGRPNITNMTLPVLATIPKIRHIGMLETFLTYEGGLEFLLPVSGQLESFDLKWSLILPEDIERFQADHPELELQNLSTMSEVASKKFRRDQLLRWASPEAAAYLKANE